MSELTLFAKSGGPLTKRISLAAREIRRGMIAALGNGELQVLCNCGLISEGLDVPDVVAAILLRPTKSLSLYLQQVGRALRPTARKAKALILDHAGVTFRFGPADVARLRARKRASRHGARPAPAYCAPILAPRCPAPTACMSMSRSGTVQTLSGF